MRILIVEDNSFNAFCLSRLLEATIRPAQLQVANDADKALLQLNKFRPDLLILDGDLGKSSHYNGPMLADKIWTSSSECVIVAWTDNIERDSDFAEVFKRHNKDFDHYTRWSKNVSASELVQAVLHLSLRKIDYSMASLALRAQTA